MREGREEAYVDISVRRIWKTPLISLHYGNLRVTSRSKNKLTPSRQTHGIVHNANDAQIAYPVTAVLGMYFFVPRPGLHPTDPMSIELNSWLNASSPELRVIIG